MTEPLHENLRTMVARSGRHRGEIAASLGVSAACLGHWLTGYREPSWERLCALLHLCGAQIQITSGDTPSGHNIPETA